MVVVTSLFLAYMPEQLAAARRCASICVGDIPKAEAPYVPCGHAPVKKSFFAFCRIVPVYVYALHVRWLSESVHVVSVEACDVQMHCQYPNRVLLSVWIQYLLHQVHVVGIVQAEG